MKNSQPKRNRWVYVGLVIMLLALLSFSMLPLVGGIVRADRSSQKTALSALQQEAAAKLEAEAKGYQVVLEREPENQNALRGLLEVRLKQGDLEGAIEPLEKLVQFDREQTDYAILLAQAKQQLNDYEGASNTYRTLLASHPEDLRALKGLTDLLLVQNRAEEAISMIKNSVLTAVKGKKTPTEITSLQLLLGEIYVAQERYPEAIATYDRAIDGNGEDFRPVLAKAIVLRQEGKESEAEPLFKQAISLAPVQYKDQIKDIGLKIAAGKPESDAVAQP